jgi:hypothetical protein
LRSPALSWVQIKDTAEAGVDAAVAGVGCCEVVDDAGEVVYPASKVDGEDVEEVTGARPPPSSWIWTGSVAVAAGTGSVAGMTVMATGTGISEVEAEGAGAVETAAEGSTAGTTTEEETGAGAPGVEAAGACVGGAVMNATLQAFSFAPRTGGGGNPHSTTIIDVAVMEFPIHICCNLHRIKHHTRQHDTSSLNHQNLLHHSTKWTKYEMKH